MMQEAQALAPLETMPLRRVEIDDGLEFHWVEAGGGPPLVFVHGVLGDWRTWWPQWSDFTAAFRCISYSRRYSVPNRNTGPSPDHSALVEAQDLAGLLPAWNAQPAVLVGSSYGAYTALALAISRPELVRALVLVEPPMLYLAELSTEGRSIRAAFDRDIRLPARKAFEEARNEDAVRLLTAGIVGREAAARLPPEAMRQRMENERSLRMLTLSREEFPRLDSEALAAVAHPTLLLAGERTPAIHDIVFRALCAAMPQAETGRIPDAGHSAARDQPAAFNARALEFLQRHRLCR